ncbi:MAG: hypothetical protein HYX75_20320 [Acidobacteria bacterium]|nr:hypothetical protein [Acidobacteriota bacterium]
MDQRPARDKVLKHLRTAVAAGTGLALACSGPHKGGAQQTQGGGSDEGPPIVCDPLPPPMNCDMELTTDRLDSMLDTDARCVKTDRGFGIELSLVVRQFFRPPRLEIAGEPTIEGAKLLNKKGHQESLILTCLPEEGKKAFHVTVRFACDTKSFISAIEVPVPVTMTEGLSVEPVVTAVRQNEKK